MPRIENTIDLENGSTTADICKACFRTGEYEELESESDDVREFLGEVDYVCEICDKSLNCRNY